VSLFFESQANKDAAQRMADTVALHFAAAVGDIMAPVGKWCVFALRDGSSDGVLYDSKDDAVRIKEPYAKDYCYLKVTPDGISPSDAWRFLRVNRLPMIDTTAPEHHVNNAVMPHMSNLTTRQKQAINQTIEREREQNAR
jgi:hypothetical protein